MNEKFGLNRSILLWGVFYLIAHAGILLIPNAIFWDDWLIYRTEPSVILESFRQAGSMFNQGGYQHVAMLAVGPWLYRVLTLVFMFATGLLLNLILQRHSSIPAETRFLIVLLFLILPFNTARVTLITFPGTLRYFMFFAAWVLIDRYRILALALFFISFSVNSLLVLYALPVLDMFYRSGNLSSLRSAMQFCLRRMDFILLPFIFFFIKVYFYKPYGTYVGYNESYSLANLITVPQVQAQQTFDMMMYYLSELFALHTSAVISFLLSALLSIFTFSILKKILWQSTGKKSISWGILILGISAMFLASFPYWIIDLVPSYYEWRSRHQLLLPLGGALTIVGAILLLDRGNRLLIISMIIGSSLAFNISTYVEVFADWQKQSQLIQLFSQEPKIEHAGLVVVRDNAAQLNAFIRTYRFYEWNGIVEKAFGNEKRFCIEGRVDLDKYLAGAFDHSFTTQYKAGEYRKNSGLPSVMVEINQVEPHGLYESLLSGVFPKITITTTEMEIGGNG